MRTVKINFSDFWRQYDPRHNLFLRLLSERYAIEYSDSPDILFYSCYGEEYLKFDCTRIFFAAENVRPDFTGCDFAITFDYLADPRHYRWPLSAFYIDYWTVKDRFLVTPDADEARKIWRSKTRFCSMVVSNANSRKRLDFFEKLSAIRHVDSGGKVFNNVGGPVKDKMKFISDHRFVFAFENTAHPGYSTEKIVEPLAVGSIPLYWGNPLIGQDFNKHRFLDASDFKDDSAFIDAIMEIDGNEEKAIHILSQPVFPGNAPPAYLDHTGLAEFLYGIVDGLGYAKPVARTYRSRLHLLKRKANVIRHFSDKLLGKNVR